VLKTDGNSSLIVTESVIEQRAWHEEFIEVTWEHCDLRKYLNKQFYDTFDPADRARILDTRITDCDNPWYGTKWGNPTVDRIFLLNTSEVVQYFGDSGDLKNNKRWHLADVKNDSELILGPHPEGHSECINDQYNDARKALYHKRYNAGWDARSWWLRSPGISPQVRPTTVVVSDDGEIWISKLAADVESKHGKKARDRVFGDIDRVEADPKSLSAWFGNFIKGMDGLDDKEFLQQMMIKHCPCGWGEAETLKQGKILKEQYEKSKTLEDYLDFLKTCDFIGDILELRGNVLYLIKPMPEELEDVGKCGRGCHCSLARYTDEYITDIFCCCCTIAHTGNMFKAAFGDSIKMEFIESIICGGKKCTMTVHLPEKTTTEA
jgi:hypothetical protein